MAPVADAMAAVANAMTAPSNALAALPDGAAARPEALASDVGAVEGVANAGSAARSGVTPEPPGTIGVFSAA
jgi:hypothetical protein